MRESKLVHMSENQLMGGVAVDPTPISGNEKVTILYNGILADSGAQNVYLHVGYGDNQNWQSVSDFRMTYTSVGWEAAINITDTSRLNFCFKDSASNWDNNGGINWSYEIHNGEQ